MILTNILHKLAPLAVAMSIACAPVQVKQTSIEKPAVTHEEPNVTYIAKQAPVWNPSTPKFGDGLGYQSGNGYGRIHGLGQMDNGYATGRDANVSIGKKRRAVIPPLFIKSKKRPRVKNHYKNQSDEFTINACRSYVNTVQNMRKNSESVLHFGPTSKLEKECIKSSKRMCGFKKIKDNRTDNRYRSCVKTSMYEGFIRPGF